jgi:hypothetical protein
MIVLDSLSGLLSGALPRNKIRDPQRHPGAVITRCTGFVDANTPPLPSAGRLIDVGGIVADTQATHALKLFLAAATGQRPDVQRPPVPGRERVPDAVTALDGGLRWHVQAFNGSYEEIVDPDTGEITIG